MCPTKQFVAGLEVGTIIARKLRRGRPRAVASRRSARLHQRQTIVRLACRGQRRRGPGHPRPATADCKAALKAERKLLKKQGFTPANVVTDKLGSYSPAAQRYCAASRQVAGRITGQRIAISHCGHANDEMKQVSPIGTALNPRRLQRVQYSTPPASRRILRVFRDQAMLIRRQATVAA
jgi:hypothetical protein